VIVEERMPGSGVLLDVVIHAECLQRLPEPAGGSRFARSLAPQLAMIAP
jgi:hypothetical protein